MSTEANKALVARFFSAIGAGWLEGLHPDLKFFVAGEMEGCGMLDLQGLAKLHALLSKDAAGPFTIVPLHMVAEGKYVTVEAEGHMELKNGRVYANHYHLVFEIEEGKIKHVREYSDTDHLRQIFDLKGSTVGERIHPLRRGVF